MATPVNLQELTQLLQELTQNVAHYQAHETSLQDRIASLEREAGDRKRILDHFALISETDTRGVITYANEKFCEVSGYSLDELIGQPHNIVRHPDTPKETFRELWETIKAGRIWQGEIKNRRKDGSYYWVLATVGPLVDSEGYPYRYISIRVDITRQKALEEQLSRERDLLAADLQANLHLAQEIQASLIAQSPAEEGNLVLDLPHFNIWKPLQIVSGDFFWTHQERSRVLIFAGDSVGHGMAGALVSALFIQELRHLVIHQGIWSPERLAEELDERLGHLFRKKLSLPITIDGTILLIDRQRFKLSYVALRGKGCLVRERVVTQFERYPFSFGDLLGQAVEERTLPLQEGDRLYLYSDGLLDQLSPSGKKWGNTRWQEFLGQLQSVPITKQGKAIWQELELWRQGQPQTDDIALLGLEVVA